MNSRYIPLAQIVANLIDSTDRSNHYFRRLYRIGIKAARKFNRDITGEAKDVLLPVASNGTVAWPNDLLDWAALYILNDCGEKVPLKFNPNIGTLKQAYLANTNSLQQVPLIPAITPGGGGVNNPGAPGASGFLWLDYVWGDLGGYIHLYGLGGGAPNIGEYTVDEQNECFYVPQGFGYTALGCEYLSDGTDNIGEGGDYLINQYAEEAIEDYIHWLSIRHLNKKYSLSEREEARKQWLRSRKFAKFNLNKNNITDMQTVFRQSVRLVAKA